MKQQQTIQYLAFDVHQATIVANCRDAEGKVVMRATVTRAILQLVKSCGPRVHLDVPDLADELEFHEPSVSGVSVTVHS